jgi:hypothetical protein
MRYQLVSVSVSVVGLLGTVARLLRTVVWGS